MYDYQWELNVLKTDKKGLSSSFNFGPVPLSRQGNLVKVRFNLYAPIEDDIFLICEANEWGAKLSDEYKLVAKGDGFHYLDLDVLHGFKYKFFVRGNLDLFQDPAARYFDDEGNCVFWDFERDDAYRPRYSFMDTQERSSKILQTDLPGLVAHFKSKSGVLGSDVDSKALYDFIAISGVIKEIKNLGFNAIQFLPFAQSIDGDNWKYRYLVPFQFAIQKNWGNPDSFLRMVDAFHREGIAVIGDFVVGHIPYKDYNIFGFDADSCGLQVWKSSEGYVYLDDKTSWGTIRPKFSDKNIRDFFVESCLFFKQIYGIDGLRIDNVDGILRYGENGDGPERPYGRVFLRELSSKVYELNPWAYVHFESHYFADSNAKWLVAPLDSFDKALGACAYNSSRLTYYFHKDYMLKSGKEISAWKFKHITDEKEWGKSNSTVADFHNHDAAAGLMSGRATGSYAYDAMCQDPANHFHAVGKIKVMEALISFGCEGRTLNLLQTFLLQTGSFEHDSSIQWFLTFNEVSKNLVNYKKRVNDVLDNPAFFPKNVGYRNFLNVDDVNKILVIERSDGESDFLIIINLTFDRAFEYAVGVKPGKDYNLVFSSDEFRFSGFGINAQPKVFQVFDSSNFELLDKEIVIPAVAPYEVIVLKR